MTSNLLIFISDGRIADAVARVAALFEDTTQLLIQVFGWDVPEETGQQTADEFERQGLIAEFCGTVIGDPISRLQTLIPNGEVHVYVTTPEQFSGLCDGWIRSQMENSQLYLIAPA